MPNRHEAPPYQNIAKVNIKQAQQFGTGDSSLHVINHGKQPVAKLEVIFDGGKWLEPSIGTSLFTMKMLAEGCSSYNASQLTSFYETKGAHIELNSGFDFCTASIYFLTSKASDILPVFKEMIFEPTFETKELQKLQQVQMQQLAINHQKTSFVAGNNFRQKLFPNHPYGTSLSEDAITSLSSKSLKAFHSRLIARKPKLVVLSGQIDDELASMVNQLFPQHKENGSSGAFEQAIEYGSNPENISNTVQASIRLGKLSISKSDPDYHKLLFCNELLGGFFGSRLMKNIREEKGLTYGIYSALVPLLNESFFVVSADIKKENVNMAIDEIKKEIAILCTEPAGNEELDLVKNYMIGSFQSDVNTPFAIAEKFKSIYLHHLDYGFFDSFFQEIQAMNAEAVMESVNRHLSPDTMVTIVAS